MEKAVVMGMNRTGAQMSPLNVEDVETFAQARQGESYLDGAGYARIHQEYIQEADPVGSVPLPGTVKGALVTVVSKMKGDQPSVLLDKIGERLAFERTGVRLYDALLIKANALSADEGGGGCAIPLIDLKAIRADEEAHFRLLVEAMKSIGGDPTAMTPCADVAGINAMGWLQVISDPRTTMAQALSTMLTVELTDNAAWELLMELAESAGHAKLVAGFSHAAAAEERHLQVIKKAVRGSVLEDVV